MEHLENAIGNEEPKRAVRKKSKDTDTKESNEELLKGQADALTRLVNHSGKSITDIAEKIGVDRQTIKIWMRGKTLIPEHKAKALGEMFNVHPAEIRYDIPAFNESDLRYVIELLEFELTLNRKALTPFQKATVINGLYCFLQEEKRTELEKFLKKQFEAKAKIMIDVAMATAIDMA